METVMNARDEPDFLKEFDEFLENIDKPKPAEPKLKLVSEAPVQVDLVAKRQRNREREVETLEEARRLIDEGHQLCVAFCKRKGIVPPPHPVEARRQMREARQAEQAQIRWRDTVAYHREMVLFHEAAEAEFRANDILRLWS
jgi:hypothetical protein